MMESNSFIKLDTELYLNINGGDSITRFFTNVLFRPISHVFSTLVEVSEKAYDYGYKLGSR